MLLKKRMFIFVVLVVILSSIVSAGTCEVSEVKTSLKTALYGFLSNPSGFMVLSVSEIKTLLVFYLKIGENEVRTECTDEIMEIMAKLGSVPMPTCSDGTEYGECSSLKPEYCFAGNLIDRCDICGCGGELCDNNTGQCNEVNLTITCNVDSDCGTDGYAERDYGCVGNNVTEDYVTYNCKNANTIHSYCTDTSIKVVIETCEFGCYKGECVLQEDITYIDSCQTLNKAGEYYRLNQSITTAGTCFRIGADNMILDLGGHSVTLTGIGDTVYANGHSRTTIKNGVFYNGGMEFRYSSGYRGYNTIKDMTMYDSKIYAYKSGGNIIKDVTMDNGGMTFSWYSGSNTIEDVTILDGDKIYFHEHSGSNTLTDVTLNDNGGIHLYKSGNNKFRGITAIDNTRGFFIEFSSRGNLIRDSTFEYNRYGISIDHMSGGNRVEYNTLIDNRYGIHMEDCTYNKIYHNTLIATEPGDAGTGITIDDSDDNIIEYNTIEYHDEGIRILGDRWGRSSNNEINYNTLIGNYNGIYDGYKGQGTKINDNIICGDGEIEEGDYDIECVYESTASGTGNTCDLLVGDCPADMCTYSCPE